MQPGPCATLGLGQIRLPLGLGRLSQHLPERRTLRGEGHGLSRPCLWARDEEPHGEGERGGPRVTEVKCLSMGLGRGKARCGALRIYQGCTTHLTELHSKWFSSG